MPDFLIETYILREAPGIGALRASDAQPTLRHFPQSFECSTLGGWIATRRAVPGEELEQWDEIKLEASEAILALDGTPEGRARPRRDYEPGRPDAADETSEL
jgi:hypothetical protein